MCVQIVYYWTLLHFLFFSANRPHNSWVTDPSISIDDLMCLSKPRLRKIAYAVSPDNLRISLATVSIAMVSDAFEWLSNDFLLSSGFWHVPFDY